MAAGAPNNSTQVEERVKADVQRSAPDSNPYLKVHWLRSLIAGLSRRIWDFYADLNRTEERLFPDTADADKAAQWGGVYIGPANPATNSSGQLVATGTVGGAIGIGETLAAGEIEFVTTSAAVIALQNLLVASITRSGTTATVTTVSGHGLSSFVPTTISGADQAEYNVTDAEIMVTGLNTFTYDVIGSPASPATGVITAQFTGANVIVQSTDFGAETNLDLDTHLTLQSPVLNVDDTMYVTFAAVRGGADEESLGEYQGRYLDKIRNPVAHFNTSDIESKAKEVTGVTRVFVKKSGAEVGTVTLSSLTRTGNVATAVTATPHGFEDGQRTSVTGANQAEYNVINAPIIIEDGTTFHYIVLSSPVTPATGGISATTSVARGQVITYFMRDNDDDPIPTALEIQAVKDKIVEILPANTADYDNVVLAPTAVPVDYVFTSILPDTPTMRTAVTANIQQFHDEETTVGVNVPEDAYRSAIQNTVDPDTGDRLQSFILSGPIGDITVGSGGIAINNGVTYL